MSDKGFTEGGGRVPAPSTSPQPATPVVRPRRRWWPSLLAIWALSLIAVWAFMASRAASLTYAHEQLQLSHRWTVARMQVLEALTQLAANNYGRAGEALASAGPSVAGVRSRLEELGLAEPGRQLTEAESQLAIGVSLAERQDSTAGVHATAVLRVLDEVRLAAEGAFGPPLVSGR